MSNPSSEKFYQLIRRNKGHGGLTCSIMSNGTEIRSPEDQREVFAQYFEDLATPKDKNYNSAFLEMCSVKHELIERWANECSTYPDLITADEVYKAISQLNPKKAADELGLVAEHLKYSGKSVVSEITDIFNQ